MNENKPSIGRPVKWTCERQESFLSDYQGRDLAVTAELALDREGNIPGLRGSSLSNLGAHTISFTPLTKSIETVPGIYRIPAAYFRGRATLSNISPLTAYRSSGRPAGRVEVVIGTGASGQGHETSFAQFLVDWLGVPFDSVQLITGETDIVPVGGGSHSGRSMRLAGITMGKVSKSIVEQGRRIASRMLEAAETDIEFGAGRFTVKGTDHSVGIFEVAAAALERDDVPAKVWRIVNAARNAATK